MTICRPKFTASISAARGLRELGESSQRTSCHVKYFMYACVMWVKGKYARKQATRIK